MKKEILNELYGTFLNTLYGSCCTSGKQDDSEGVTLSPESFIDVKAFLDIFPGRIHYPKMQLLATGSLLLFFHETGLYVSLIFPGTGIVEYKIEYNKEESTGQFNIPFDQVPDLVKRVVIWDIESQV